MLPRTDIPALGYTLTQSRKPRTGEKPLLVQFRNGWCDPKPYTAGQLDWNDTGHSWDVVAVKLA